MRVTRDLWTIHGGHAACEAPNGQAMGNEDELEQWPSSSNLPNIRREKDRSRHSFHQKKSQNTPQGN